MDFKRLVQALLLLLLPELDPQIDYINPYPNKFLYWIDTISTYLTRPSRIIFDTLLSCFIWTTEEMKKPYIKLLYCAIVAPLTLLLYLASFPIVFLGWVMWAPIAKLKTPYRMSIHHAIACHPQLQGKYCVGTTNLCIMPEFVSRINNMCSTWQRAVDAGGRVATQQLKYCYSHQGNKYRVLDRNQNNADRGDNREGPNINHTNMNGHYSSGNFTQNKYNVEHINHDVIEEFPPMDFLLVQEAWDLVWSRDFGRELHRVYPYIVQDVGVYSWGSNCFLSNSGLMIASKFPFMEVSFNWFRTRCSQDRMASKGLLQVKVNLGTDNQGRTVVGYLNNTHMQAYKGNLPIHSGQLYEIHVLTEHFRHNTLKPNEVVAFDIFGGDFNFDNISPVDRPESRHPIFAKYVDLGRVQPGIDHKWIVGTEMRQIPLHEPQISTPPGLKRALEDPYMLQHYILDGDVESHCYKLMKVMPKRDEKGDVILSPVGGKRRIDYVMFKEGDGVVPVAFNAVSLMAGLTDHIPYCLTFKALYS